MMRYLRVYDQEVLAFVETCRENFQWFMDPMDPMETLTSPSLWWFIGSSCKSPTSSAWFTEDTITTAPTLMHDAHHHSFMASLVSPPTSVPMLNLSHMANVLRSIGVMGVSCVLSWRAVNRHCAVVPHTVFYQSDWTGFPAEWFQSHRWGFSKNRKLSIGVGLLLFVTHWLIGGMVQGERLRSIQEGIPPSSNSAQFSCTTSRPHSSAIVMFSMQRYTSSILLHTMHVLDCLVRAL